jgi:hypothetical protein
MKNLLPALLACKKAIPAIKRSAANPFFNSNYAPLEAILETVEPILFSQGLVIVQSVDTEPLTLVTTLYHVASGESLSSNYPLPAGLDSQKLGSAVTYARRYAISALLSLATEPDDDGNGASDKPQAKPAKKTVAASNDELF